MKAKKILLLLVLAFAITGCKKTVIPSNYQDALQANSALKDCTAHYVGDGWSSITVVRCPLSTTTTSYTEGKHTETNIVIDGVTYEAKN